MSSGKRSGPPKHQNKYAWKPNADRKINETEVGGKFKPLSEITGVCPRCKDQIEWKRRYGKYKPLVQPAKCQRCSKRNVRQAYHNLCSGGKKKRVWVQLVGAGCAKEHGVCAKCCCSRDRIVGRDSSEVEAEQKMLEEAIKNARERERRTLLRAMNKDKSKSSKNTPTDTKDNKVGQLFPNASLEDYAKRNRVSADNDDGEIYDDSEGEVYEVEDDKSENEDRDEGDDSENEEGNGGEVSEDEDDKIDKEDRDDSENEEGNNDKCHI